MTESFDTNESDTNTKLIYEYTENSLKLLNDSITTLNTKFSAVIAFSGLLIKFSTGLPDSSLSISLSNGIELSCYLCLILKVLVCISLIIAIGISLLGYCPIEGGEIVKPEYLLDMWRNRPEEKYRIAFIKNWGKSMAELDYIRKKRAKLLQYAIYAVGIATLLSALDVILASILTLSC